MPPAKFREPGKVWAGASAGVEWTRELQTERGFPWVGFDGEGTVITAQGIRLNMFKLYLKEMVVLFKLKP